VSTQTAAAAAARSSLFTPEATRQARADWLAGKQQQQQDAAAALERDLQKRQLLLQKLACRRKDAEVAHAQVRAPWCAQPSLLSSP
jgi:septal ring factor EnvC (AmiA/AmiB activator)